MPYWPDRPSTRRPSPFSATWPQTIGLLQREVDQLGAHELVVELGMTETDIRTDGWPRANARASHPGVAISFTTRRQGPLRFATDVFNHWQDNLRAVALGLEALRRVDRYGITKSGEQYRGWRALPARAASNGNGFGSKEEAAAFIVAAAGIAPVPDEIRKVIDVPTYRAGAFRLAAKRLHPDAGGDPSEFARLEAARKLVET